MNGLFYEKPKFKIGNPNYFLYMCEGQRGRGKSTWWLQQPLLHFFETGNKFVYLRRKDTELQLAVEKGLFNCCRVPKENHSFWANYPSVEISGGNIYLVDKEKKKIHVGYTLTLNNVKGISIEDADVLIFDEYVAAKRGEYKGGEHGVHEPELFLRLLETIFRRRKFWAILLGNRDTPSNPYNEYWHIPFGATLHKNKQYGIWYEYDYSEATAQSKEETTIGIISRGTTYSDYSMGVRALGELNDCLIADKPSHAIPRYNIRMFGKDISVWLDQTNAVLYLTDKVKYNPAMPTISVTNADMSINTDFIKYDIDFLNIMRMFYGRGQMRFSSQEIASLFSTMLSLK